MAKLPRTDIVYVVGTARRKLVASRSRADDRMVYGEEVPIPVEPFHAVTGEDDGIAACGATVRWAFGELEFGTRAQNCPRCQAIVSG